MLDSRADEARHVAGPCPRDGASDLFLLENDGPVITVQCGWCHGYWTRDTRPDVAKRPAGLTDVTWTELV